MSVDHFEAPYVSYKDVGCGCIKQRVFRLELALNSFIKQQIWFKSSKNIIIYQEK